MTGHAAARAFDQVRLARIVAGLPVGTAALAVTVLLAGLVLRIAGVVAVTATALTARLSHAVALYDAAALTVALGALLVVLRLVSLAVVAAIHLTDTAATAVLAHAQEGSL